MTQKYSETLQQLELNYDGLCLLPPKQDVCPECATKHEPDQPHNQQSLYYRMQFRIKYGRSPIWEDAMSHCNEETKRIWRDELVKAGEKLGKQ